MKNWYILQHGWMLKICYMKETSHKKSHILWFHLYETSGRSKSLSSKCILVFCLCLDELRENGQWLLKYMVSYWGDKMFYSLLLWIVVQFREYIQNHWTVHFKQVVSMVCESYFSLFPLEVIVWLLLHMDERN